MRQQDRLAVIYSAKPCLDTLIKSRADGCSRMDIKPRTPVLRCIQRHFNAIIYRSKIIFYDLKN